MEGKSLNGPLGKKGGQGSRFHLGGKGPESGKGTKVKGQPTMKKTNGKHSGNEGGGETALRENHQG